MKMTSSLKLLGTLVLVGIISTGCSYNVPKYSESVKNVNILKKLKTKISVGKFTAKEKNVSSITCRAAGGVGFEDKTPFEKYIQKAFISELKLAGKYNPKSRIKISGHLQKIDFNANINTSDWLMTLKVKSSNSKYFVVKTKYEFEGSFIADKACSDVAHAFVPAVQKLIHRIITSKKFKKLL